MSSLYALSYKDNRGRETSLENYRGKVLLVANTASKCGFTPQYEGLQKLYDTYKDRGLAVIGFPCDQFAGQEPGNDQAIEEFCKVNFGVTFPLAAKSDVNGPQTNPVFRYLKKKTFNLFGPGIKWNFTKFLISADGKKVLRFSPTTKPEALAGKIEAFLKQ